MSDLRFGLRGRPRPFYKTHRRSRFRRLDHKIRTAQRLEIHHLSDLGFGLRGRQNPQVASEAKAEVTLLVYLEALSISYFMVRPSKVPPSMNIFQNGLGWPRRPKPRSLYYCISRRWAFLILWSKLLKWLLLWVFGERPRAASEAKTEATS